MRQLVPIQTRRGLFFAHTCFLCGSLPRCAFTVREHTHAYVVCNGFYVPGHYHMAFHGTVDAAIKQWNLANSVPLNILVSRYAAARYA